MSLQTCPLPRFMLAAPASGSGKTIFTCAIIKALQNRGLKVRGFKCGPDYIDTRFHSKILGIPSHNLDLFLMGKPAVNAVLAQQGTGGDIAVIEGVMGYYDGLGGESTTASTYHVAHSTTSPVFLVLDGSGSSVSLAATAQGFLGYKNPSHIAGFLLNKVTPGIYPRLKALLEKATALPVLGYLPKTPHAILGSRHLGLIGADEVANLHQSIDALAQLCASTIDFNAILAIAKAAPPVAYSPLTASAIVTSHTPVIAIAKGKAFMFYYAAALQLLQQLGAQLVEFDPLTDTALPPHTAGLYLGGGYPELYAKELSQNKPMLAAIKTALANGIPCVAECGGFLYLHRSLRDDKGVHYPQAGVVDACAEGSDRLQNFGYGTLTASIDNLLCQKGESLPVHEFHYWHSTPAGTAFTTAKPINGRSWQGGYASPTQFMGYGHLHFCGAPKAAARFVTACAQYGQEREATK